MSSPVPQQNVQFALFRTPEVKPGGQGHLRVFWGTPDERPKTLEAWSDFTLHFARNPVAVAEAKTSSELIDEVWMQGIPDESEMSLIPCVPGLEFIPSRRVVDWKNTAGHVDFDFVVSSRYRQDKIVGKILVLQGVIIVAQFALTLSCTQGSISDRFALIEDTRECLLPKIYTSYSRKDLAVARQVEQFSGLGSHEKIRDCEVVVSRGSWDSRLEQDIRKSDLFQLFWSTQSLKSPRVKREWETALSLRAQFPGLICPVYWETELPKSKRLELPSASLLQHEFVSIRSIGDGETDLQGAVLREIKGSKALRKFLIGGRTLLGRQSLSDVRLKGNLISRKHARIVFDGVDYWIEDLKSRNKTYVNEQPITKTKLVDGDQIRICGYVFMFDSSGELTDGPFAGRGRDGDSTVKGIPVNLGPESGKDQSSIISKIDVSDSLDSRRFADLEEQSLSKLLSILPALTPSKMTDSAMSDILQILLDTFPQAGRALYLRKEAEGDYRVLSWRSRNNDTPSVVRISRQVLEMVTDTRQAVLSSNIASDDRFHANGSLRQLEIQSLICAPQQGTNGEIYGIFELDATDEDQAFSQDDLNFVATVACLTALSFENRKLREERIQAGISKAERDLAAEMQLCFLPIYPPDVPRLQCFDFYKPATVVGGDIYDYVELSDDLVAVVVADVVGHGIPAALLMAKLSTVIKFALASTEDLVAAIQQINRRMCDTHLDKFATMVICLINTKTFEVQVVNAGHQPPLIRRTDGRVDSIESEEADFPIGMFDDVDYQLCHTNLGPNETLLLGSDGIWEVSGLHEQEFGIERLRAKFEEAVGNADDIGDHLVHSVLEYAAGGPPEDDMCLVCIQRVE